MSGDNVGRDEDSHRRPRAVVVMGPSGCGKTTIGKRLARARGAVFIDADDHHSSANVEKMRAGVGLTDEDRTPWLATLSSLLRQRDEDVVLACSALKANYRNALRGGNSAILFVLLRVPPDELRKRLSSRAGHFAPPTLLTSQLEALEPPAADNSLGEVTVDGTGEIEEVLARVQALLG